MDKYGSFNQTEHSFSRDQQRKVYVQDRILENAKEFNQWIEKMNIYYCGQKIRCLKSEQTLVEISSQRNVSGRTSN
jgi:sulfite reductase (NADPH) flavoprotein alpha-component